MSEVTENKDTTVKLTKKALNKLETKAKPFESKRECLERIIMQNCGSPNQKEESEEESDRESKMEAKA